MDQAKVIEELAHNVETFTDKAGKALGSLTERIEALEANRSRPGATAGRSAERKAFEQFAKTGQLETKEMSIGGGAANGEALVPEQIADEIISQALAQSRLASLVRRTRVDTSDYVRLTNARGQAAAWSSETGTRNATASMELRERRPTHGELYSLIPVSNWLLADSKFNLAEFIVQNAAEQFAKAIEAAILTGDGSDKPTGLLNTATAATADFASPQRNVAALQHKVTTGDTATDIVSLFFTLAPEYRARSTWLMSSGVLASLRSLRAEAGDGQFLWQQNLSAAVDAPDGLLLGRPVATSESLPAVLSTSPQGRKVIVGDFSTGYELVEIGGMTVLRDPYSTKGKTSFFISQRFGGTVVDNHAIKVLLA